jgi:hypothetical protein
LIARFANQKVKTREIGAELKVKIRMNAGFVSNVRSNQMPINKDTITIISVTHPTCPPITAGVVTKLGVPGVFFKGFPVWFMDGEFYHKLLISVNNFIPIFT